MDSTFWFWLGLCGVATILIALVIFLFFAIMRFTGRGFLGFLGFIAGTSKNDSTEPHREPGRPVPDLQRLTRSANSDFDQALAARIVERETTTPGGFQPVVPSAQAAPPANPPQQAGFPVNNPQQAGFPVPGAQPPSSPVYTTPQPPPEPLPPYEPQPPGLESHERRRRREGDGDDLIGAFYGEDEGDGIF